MTFQRGLHIGDERLLVSVPTPLTLRMQLDKEFDIIKACGVSAIVGATRLGHHLAHLVELCHLVPQPVGHLHTLAERDALRHGGADVDAPLVHLGQELCTQKKEDAKSARNDHHADGHHHPAVTVQPGKDAVAHTVHHLEETVVVLLHIFFQQHRRQHRNQRQRENQCSQKGKTECESQWREHLSLHFLEGKNGHQGGDDNEFGEGHRTGFLVGRCPNGTALAPPCKGLAPHSSLTVVEHHEDALHHHHGTVDDDSEIDSTHRQQIGTHSA